jgi:hypothetical protein
MGGTRIDMAEVLGEHYPRLSAIVPAISTPVVSTPTFFSLC